MRSLVVIALFSIGCMDPFAPTGAMQDVAPPNAAAMWAEVEACSGHHGLLPMVQWRTVPGTAFPYVDGRLVYGTWEPAHNIYLSDVGRTMPLVVKHEMLHELLQSGEHGPAFEKCGLAY